MQFLFSLVLAVIIAFTAKATLKRYPYQIYAASLVLALFCCLYPFPRTLPQPVLFVLNLFQRGSLAGALWIIVMWTGALPNGSWLIKKLMPVRRELSILASSLTLGHNIGYGRTYFVRLFTNASEMPANQKAACIITIILIIIMIPLTILSFPNVRKRMPAKKWKQYQRSSYIFYALLYVHIMLLFFPLAKSGRDGYYASVIIYTAIFLSYALCRIRKWCFVRKKLPQRREITSICIGLFLVIMVIMCAVSRPNNTAANDENVSQTIEAASESLESVSENSTYTAAEMTSGDNSDEASESPNSTLKDGVYEGKAAGYDGVVKATVTIQGGKITDISCTSAESDLWYFEKCEKKVIAEILDAQDTDVDAVSGATYSSNGIKNAVQEALEKAGGNESQ